MSLSVSLPLKEFSMIFAINLAFDAITFDRCSDVVMLIIRRLENSVMISENVSEGKAIIPFSVTVPMVACECKFPLTYRLKVR